MAPWTGAVVAGVLATISAELQQPSQHGNETPLLSFFYGGKVLCGFLCLLLRGALSSWGAAVCCGFYLGWNISPLPTAGTRACHTNHPRMLQCPPCIPVMRGEGEDEASLAVHGAVRHCECHVARCCAHAHLLCVCVHAMPFPAVRQGARHGP